MKSKERDVDPVGACVGMKGSRVQSVVQELRGERIDIIAWDEDPAKFVCNALQPAEIIRVLVNESEKMMEVIVPEEQLLLAIGKRGQNVKLASKLVGWKIEVRAEGQVEDALKKAEGLFAPKKAAEEAPPGETTSGEAPPGEEREEAKAEPDASGTAGQAAEGPPPGEESREGRAPEEPSTETPGDGSGTQ